MRIIREPYEMRRWSRAQRAAGHSIGFVPTMGYLHDGHLSLVRAARERADRVVASIYVNPTQFGPNEDFDVYPRDPDGDRAKLEALGCDACFEPEDLYVHTDPPHETWVEVEHLSGPLCGASRPGFFRGVATVVTKLFHIVEPDLAVFGRKDYQQSRVIERLVRDLDFGIEIVAMPIVRESDGLAMSSRNVRLSADERHRALSINRVLRDARDSVAHGEDDPLLITSAARGEVERAGGRVDYIELVDALTLKPIGHIERPALLAIAAAFGSVRLIDNAELIPPLPTTQTPDH